MTVLSPSNCKSEVSIYQVLSNCLSYLNSHDVIPNEAGSAHILYRLRFVNLAVMIEGFIAVSDGKEIIAKHDIKDDCFWIGKRHAAYEDFSPEQEDGQDFVRLYTPCRSLGYGTFFIHENSPIVSLRLAGDLARQFMTRNVGMHAPEKNKTPRTPTPTASQPTTPPVRLNDDEFLKLITV